jgi:hypothetical protein
LDTAENQTLHPRDNNAGMGIMCPFSGDYLQYAEPGLPRTQLLDRGEWQEEISGEKGIAPFAGGAKTVTFDHRGTTHHTTK